MIETGFSFQGLHCETDFGMVFVEDGRTVTPQKVVNEYSIAGTDGTVRFEGETYQTYERRGTLVPLISPPNEMAAQETLRRVSAWLHSGRGKLIFDREPDKYLIAECVGPLTWSTQAWMDGGLEVAFVCQPYAYAITEQAYSLTVTTNWTHEADLTELWVQVDSGVPVPVTMTVTNTGQVNVKQFALFVMGGTNNNTVLQKVHYNNVAMPPGAKITHTGEPPIEALYHNGGKVTNAMPYCIRWDRLMVQGRTRMKFGAVFATAEGKSQAAKVDVRVRGRWI